MPNTLVHLGLQGALVRAGWRRADMGWAFLGCVLPDLPWILRRIVIACAPGVDLLDLQLYTAVQASLGACLVLAAAFAVLSAAPVRVWGMLAAMSAVHLLLVAMEIKWSNGVLLFVPFDWRLVSWGLVWPESWPVQALTLAGLGLAAWLAPQAWRGVWRLRLREPRRWAAAAGLTALYIVLPLAGMERLEAQGHYGVRTLRDRATRTGKAIAMERAGFVRGGEWDEVIALDGERLRLEGPRAERDGLMSVAGVFTAPDRVRVERMHIHPKGLRDLASTVGVAFVGVLWGLRLAREVRSAPHLPWRTE